MILFEVFLKADDRVEFIYENLQLFVMGIVTVYVIPLYYCFHNVFGGALDLDFAANVALTIIRCRIQMNSFWGRLWCG